MSYTCSLCGELVAIRWPCLIWLCFSPLHVGRWTVPTIRICCRSQFPCTRTKKVTTLVRGSRQSITTSCRRFCSLTLRLMAVYCFARRVCPFCTKKRCRPFAEFNGPWITQKVGGSVSCLQGPRGIIAEYGRGVNTKKPRSLPSGAEVSDFSGAIAFGKLIMSDQCADNSHQPTARTGHRSHASIF